MPRRYCAFMVRCWAFDERVQRAEIECIPSGEKIAVRSLAEAVAWMAVRTVIAEPATAATAESEAERTRDANDQST